MPSIPKCARLAALFLASALGACTQINACGVTGRLARHEYRFVNSRGEPVPGVTMRVVDADGNGLESEPVPEFVGGRGPISDAEGVLTFHSVRRFHARDTTYLGFIPVWQKEFGSDPRLVFELQRQTVKRIELDDTDRGKDVRITHEPWEARDRPIAEDEAFEDIEVIQRTFRIKG